MLRPIAAVTRVTQNGDFLRISPKNIVCKSLRWVTPVTRRYPAGRTITILRWYH
jgi:hypothetical protein